MYRTVTSVIHIGPMQVPIFRLFSPLAGFRAAQNEVSFNCRNNTRVKLSLHQNPNAYQCPHTGRFKMLERWTF